MRQGEDLSSPLISSPLPPPVSVWKGYLGKNSEYEMLMLETSSPGALFTGTQLGNSQVQN